MTASNDSAPHSNSAAGIAPLPSRPAWKALAAHFASVKDIELKQLFADDPRRGERLTTEAMGVYFDYSKNRVTDTTIELLLQLAAESGLRERIDAMFRGDRINVSENRAVLHVALRAPRGASIVLDGKNVVPDVHAVLDRMAQFADRVRSGAWTGHTGKRIRNVINVGIGGSDLGPVMAYEALKHYSDRAMTFRFVSNVDGTDFAEAVHGLDAAEALFIISSKTFTTLETMTNAQTARDCRWPAWAVTPRPWRSTSSRYRPTRKRFPPSASTPPTCSGSGIGWAAAIRWIRPSGCPRCSPSVPTTSARCSRASTKWTSTSARRRSSATCPC